jgi:hypothetical protein
MSSVGNRIAGSEGFKDCSGYGIGVESGPNSSRGDGERDSIEAGNSEKMGERAGG